MHAVTPRSVVVTGAFGNVGRSTVAALLAAGQRVVAFDLPTRRNRLQAARLHRRGVSPVWGDVTDPVAVADAVGRAEAVAHLAALIPPGSDRDPARTRHVNVEGTRVVAAAAAARGARLVHASSYAVYGCTQHLAPPRRVDDPVAPADPYGRTKADAEEIVRASGAEWVVLRFGSVLPLRLPLVVDKLVFEVPLDTRVEFVHPHDVGLAVARACVRPGVVGRTLNVGGGPGCQVREREIVGRPMEVLGIGMLPDEAFATRPYHCDWLDSTESQALLQYQRHTFDDYVAHLGRRYGWRRPLMRRIAPLVRRSMLRSSPYLPASAPPR